MFFTNVNQIKSINTDAQSNKIVINGIDIDSTLIKLISNWSEQQQIAKVVTHKVYNAEVDNISHKVDGVVTKLPMKESIVFETTDSKLISVSVYREDV